MRRILIANRGEIAVRIARTCRELGIQSIAVFSEADRFAQHVLACDEAYFIGESEPSKSYLVVDKIIEIAKASGAEGIHPGYGFLSENAGFARRCKEANIRFIGPNVEAIEYMGSKALSKTLMGDAGVPLVPGYHGEAQDDSLLKSEAVKIGFPVMIKASAGGGGKGMRMVATEPEFDENLASARREAMASFADDRILIEKFIVRPRHVEIQVFGDEQGNVVYLSERDCSIQRRHQKVVEEAPAPGLSDELRLEMGVAAVKAAKAINYVGAGTVEFIMSANNEFFFMEMNTRLQVEHPVTEMITGEDLVSWQIQIARGETLPKKQEEIKLNGHALEVRWYAENPDQNFLPSTGTLERLWLPKESDSQRYDLGVVEGDTISTFYDPMIGKLIVWAENRHQACSKMQQLLSSARVMGIQTNLAYLERIVGHPSFIDGSVHTGFLEEHAEVMASDRFTAEPEVIAISAMALFLSDQKGSQYDPWQATDGWRMNLTNSHPMHLVLDENNQWDVQCHFKEDNCYEMTWDDQTLTLRNPVIKDGYMQVDIHGRIIKVPLMATTSKVQLYWHNQWEISLADPFDEVTDQSSGSKRVTAPMPGRVFEVMVAAGDKVEEGQVLAILEAMKMEHSVRAQQDGEIGEVFFQPGDTVSEGAELMTFVDVE